MNEDILIQNYNMEVHSLFTSPLRIIGLTDGDTLFTIFRDSDTLECRSRFVIRVNGDFLWDFFLDMDEELEYMKGSFIDDLIKRWKIHKL